MFPCEGVYWIRNKSLSNRFIDVRKEPYVHAGERASMPIGLYSPRLTRPQLWLVEQFWDGESFIIRNFSSSTSTVLGIQDGSTAQHTPIIVQEDDENGQGSQHWNIVWNCDDDKIPYYRITNQKTKTVITQTKNTVNGADFAIESCDPDGSEQQLWAFERATFPTIYWFVNMSMDRCLNYIPGDTVYLSKKTEFPSGGQLWYLEDLVDQEGYCTIRNVGSEDRVLELSSDDDTSILASTATGDTKQKWRIVDVNFNGVVTVVCARKNAVLYGTEDRERMFYPRAATDEETFAHNYLWRLVPCATPSLFWTTVQCRGTGKFLSRYNRKAIASNGARGEIDYDVQWRFVTEGCKPRFKIINRHFKRFLCASSESKSSLDSDNDPSLDLCLCPTSHSTPSDSNFTSGPVERDAPSSKNCSWSVDCAGEDYSITHVETSKVIVCTNDGKIELASGGATDANRHWLVNSSLQSVPSYAIINGYTGMALAYISGLKSGSVTTDTAFNSYESLWIFQQVGTDSDDRPIYVIINKLSDHVLSHTGEKTIEALDDDPKDPHHQWRIVLCHERYFAFVNVATGECLNDDGDPPSDHQGTIPEKECRCCWTLVSYRHSVHDTIAVDTDISNPDQSFFDVAKRGPKKHPKGKGNAKAEPNHIPDNPRIRQVDNRVLLDIVERLINQWDIDTIPASQQAGRPVSTSRDEVLRWGLNVPRSLQVGWTRDGWIRIDIQGTYNDQNGVRVANIQGQWNNDTIFHIIVPTGVNFGRARIRQAMHESLRTGTSVRLDAPDNTKPSGSKHKPNTTPRPPGPGAPPAGQFWAITLLSYVTVASLGLMVL